MRRAQLRRNSRVRAQFASAQFADARLLTPLRYADAVHNISRAAMLVNCFATSQFDPLRYAMEDKLHQPHRKHMFPYYPIIEASLEAGAPRATTARTHALLLAARRSSLTASRAPPAAGAHGAFLSGAGPTVLAIAGGVGASGVGTDTMSQFLAEAVSEAMTKEALKHNITGTVHIAQATETGVVSSGYSKDGAVLWSESGKRKLVAGAPQGVKASD